MRRWLVASVVAFAATAAVVGSALAAAPKHHGAPPVPQTFRHLDAPRPPAKFRRRVRPHTDPYPGQEGAPPLPPAFLAVTGGTPPPDSPSCTTTRALGPEGVTSSHPWAIQGNAPAYTGSCNVEFIIGFELQVSLDDGTWSNGTDCATGDNGHDGDMGADCTTFVPFGGGGCDGGLRFCANTLVNVGQQAALRWGTASSNVCGTNYIRWDLWFYDLNGDAFLHRYSNDGGQWTFNCADGTAQIIGSAASGSD